MLSPAFAMFTEHNMPFFLQLFFRVTAIVLFLVCWLSVREWKSKTGENRIIPHRLPPEMRLQVRLGILGSMISWGIASPDWQVRAFFGGASLVAIVIILYSPHADAEPPSPFDRESVLHVEQQPSPVALSKS